MLKQDLPSHGKLDHANDTFRIRKMRNILAKLQEAQKLQSLGKTNASEFHNLMRSLHQSQFFTPGQSLNNNAKNVKNQLDDNRRAQCRSRINKWKAELQSSTQACYKWLRRPAPQIFRGLISSALNHRNVTCDIPESLELIRNHWQLVEQTACQH